MVNGLAVPVLTADSDAMSAALAYADAGWYVLPIVRGTKNPGSVVGKDWQRQSSRDPRMIAAWYPGTDHGVALHCGRSGAIVFDVDNPARMPAVLAEAIAETNPPFQSTRDSDPGRGHYVFAMPDGRRLGNGTGALSVGWGDVRGANGVIVAAPSPHANGGRYAWQTTGTVPALPATVAALLTGTESEQGAVTDAQVDAFLARHDKADRPELLTAVLSKMDNEISRGGSRHNAAVNAACWAMRETQVGCYPAEAAARQIGSRLADALAGEPNRRPDAEWAGILAWAIGQALADNPAARLQAIDERRPHVDTLVARLLDQVKTWQHLPDPTPVLASLTVAVTAEDTEGEPAWLLLVHVPSSGKTEIVRMLDDITADRLDDVTVAGLLSWTKSKPPRRTGVLTRVTHGLVTFGDLSTLVASSEKTGSRDEIFALLRRVYDGHAQRDIGAPSGAKVSGPLSWEGRLSVVGAVTGAIDQYSVHASALGARWLYCRLPNRTTDEKRAAARMARHGDLSQRRDEARNLAARVVRAARPRLAPITIPDVMADAIENAALVCCWGRAAVPRHGNGNREIDGEATIEEPPRLVRQLTTMARGLLALGCSPDYTTAVCRRLALDSMPAVRRSVLDILTRTSQPTTAEVARQARLDRGVTRRALEDLEVIGVVHGQRQGEARDAEWPDRRTCQWSLVDGDDGMLITMVLTAADTDRREVFRNCATYTPSPQHKEDRCA